MHLALRCLKFYGHLRFLLIVFFCGLVFSTHTQAAEIDLKGLIDLRLQTSNANESWLNAGLSKQRFDKNDSFAQLGQSALELKTEITDTASMKAVFNGYTDRNKFVDMTELYAQWKPLPIEGYRIKTKLGAFFPAISLENGATGWTNPWMISSSAINTWVGEELRTKGIEFTLSRPGLLHNSAQDIDFVYSIFTANDPATALLVWRGWSIGDRVTGLSEALKLPDLPKVYGASGLFNVQDSVEHPFHEVDQHTGYYAGVNYSYNNWFSLRALHYNNHGDPLGIKGGQWGWDNQFDHLGLRADFSEATSVIAQAMQGSSVWGVKNYGVYVDYKSWFFLVSHRIDQQRISIRYDSFNLTNEDTTYIDDNSEKGHGIAIAWQFLMDHHQQIGAEYLKIFSNRPGRIDLHRSFYQAQSNGLALSAAETSFQVFYRYNF